MIIASQWQCDEEGVGRALMVGSKTLVSGVWFRACLFGIVVLIAACGTEEAGSNRTGSSASQQSSTASTSACQDPITWDQAGKHVEKVASVTGLVVDRNYAAKSRGRPTFVNLGRPYPSPSRFTIVIWGADRPRFDENPEDMYAGKRVCVTGRITTFEDLPQIVVDDPQQIAFLEDSSSRQRDSASFRPVFASYPESTAA